MKAPFFVLCGLCASLSTLSAQSFFKTTPVYVAPSWRGGGNSEFSNWDVFYSPYYGPYTQNGSTFSDGINYPDMGIQIDGNYWDAPFGFGSPAADSALTPPANTSGVAYAYWDVRNPTLRQVLAPAAFIIQPDIFGNIYSFAGPTGYELVDSTSDDATPFTLGTVVLQWQTAGSIMDFSSLRLVTQSGEEIAPNNFITEYRQGGGPMGGIDNRSAAQWDLTGRNISSYTIKFQSATSSNSLQELLLDTAATFLEAVPSARTWTGTSGTWSSGANWSGGTVGPVGGNITFSGGTAVTIDGGLREVGQLNFTSAGAFAINVSGDGALKVNTGISAKPAGGIVATIFAPYQIGSFNFMEIGAGSDITIAGAVSGNSGFYKFGAGTLRMTGGGNISGSILLENGSLVFGGSTTAGEIAVSAGARLIVNGILGSGSLTLNGGTVGGGGTINRTFTLDGNDTVSPGDGVGTLATLGQTWAAGGTFRFELADADAGAGVGWDLVSINGSLSLTATPSGKFTLSLATFGLAPDFNPAQNYLWRFATASGGISGFDPADFAFIAADFAGANGIFSVTREGNDLFLNYAAVPEASTGMMCVLGVAIFAVWRNRRVISGREDAD